MDFELITNRGTRYVYNSSHKEMRKYHKQYLRGMLAKGWRLGELRFVWTPLHPVHNLSLKRIIEQEIEEAHDFLKTPLKGSLG